MTLRCQTRHGQADKQRELAVLSFTRLCETISFLFKSFVICEIICEEDLISNAHIWNDSNQISGGLMCGSKCQVENVDPALLKVNTANPQ